MNNNRGFQRPMGPMGTFPLGSPNMSGNRPVSTQHQQMLPGMQRMPGPRPGMSIPGMGHPLRPPASPGGGPRMCINQAAMQLSQQQQQELQQNLLVTAAGQLIRGHLQMKQQQLQQLQQHMHNKQLQQHQIQTHIQQQIASNLTAGNQAMNNARFAGHRKPVVNNSNFPVNGNRFRPPHARCPMPSAPQPGNPPFKGNGVRPMEPFRPQRPPFQGPSREGPSGPFPPRPSDPSIRSSDPTLNQNKDILSADCRQYDRDRPPSSPGSFRVSDVPFDKDAKSSPSRMRNSSDKRYQSSDKSYSRRRYSDRERPRDDSPNSKYSLPSSSARLCPFSQSLDRRRSSHTSRRDRERRHRDNSVQDKKPYPSSSRYASDTRRDYSGAVQNGGAEGEEYEEGEISSSEHSSSPYSHRGREERMSRDSMSTSSSDKSSVRSGMREERKYGIRERERDSERDRDNERSSERGRKRKHDDLEEWDFDSDDEERRLDRRYRAEEKEFWRSLDISPKEAGPPVVEAPPEENIPQWIRSSPADLYFTRSSNGNLVATQRMKELEDVFEEEIVKRAEKVRTSLPPVELPPRPQPTCHHHHHHSGDESDSSSSSSSSDSEEDDSACSRWMEEMERKKKHPYCLHPELWYNDPGEMNNGPLCRCSVKARKTGIRHDVYPEEKYVQPCDPASNNLDHLYHYHITMSPAINFLTNSPTVIEFDNHEFIFEGFSLFTHEKLENVPLCKVIRFHIEYTIHFIEETAPEHFTCRSLDLLNRFLFTEILELVDMDWKGFGGGCNRFHIMPRFARSLPENGKEILSVNEVIKYLIRSSCPLVAESDFPLIEKMSKEDWQSWVENVNGMIVTYPGKKPSSVRVDQLDRTKLLEGEKVAPILVHFGIRPAQLSYAGDPAYQKAWKYYVRFKHLLNSKPKVTHEDKIKLKNKEANLQEIQLKSTMKREVTVELSSEGFVRTGIKSDICQHALLLPVLLSHLRFHACLSVLEQYLGYHFKDRALLQLALTHTSFRTNYGTNAAHARNSLTNCGLRQVEYGDRRVYYQNTRKRGINILVDIMSRLGQKEEVASEIPHNERLEFLGDAVVEFLSSVHLFYMFPWLEEGGLSTYRTAIVQNQHLSVLAKHLHLQDFMLYVHGPDLCHESDLRHAMANCFEALMGALFLDGGLEVVDEIFARTLFGDEETCLKVWLEPPLHPLQEDEPGGDRHWVDSSPALKKLLSFEEATGIKFSHIRLLAKSFTHRNVGYNLLTMGHNQRLEFLGDTVLQLIASEYLYRHFPEHHEGHLSLLRSSLVNSRTQAIVCDDLGMTSYVIYSNVGIENMDMKTKQKADLLESFLGALYVDKGMEYCKAFCDVCFFPRLKDFIYNQDWNDPKSQLQQCCLTLRKLGGGEPDIPIYKVIESLGPSNTRKYVVAVYFRGERLATGTGHSIQQAEMSAATNALKKRSELFPILQHQRRFLDKRRGGGDKHRPRSYKSQDNQDSCVFSSSSSSVHSTPVPDSRSQTPACQ